MLRLNICKSNFTMKIVKNMRKQGKKDWSIGLTPDLFSFFNILFKSKFLDHPVASGANPMK
jgi:hypothetical protein